MTTTRRLFLKAAATTLALARPAFSILAANPTYRASIIGHTGRGNYGHDQDLLFTNHDKIQLLAIADPDPAGRAKAAARAKPLRQYDDYRQMLEKEKPNLVSIAPRFTEEHHAMAMAALATGSHIISEKPFMTTLAEADEVLATANKSGLKIAVSHQIRLSPIITYLKQRVDAGLIGDLLQLHAHGKQDARAGGEDMLVLGCHQFDLLRLFAGDALSCSARITQNGHDITKADAHPVKEAIGPIAGDSVFAHFSFNNAINATFTSNAKLRETLGPWGMDLIGSKATIRVLTDVFPTLYISPNVPNDPTGTKREWKRLEGDPGLTTAKSEQGFGPANRRVVDDWLRAIETNGEPSCSGLNATKALEMIHAAWASALTNQRIPIPLKDRRHPLA